MMELLVNIISAKLANIIHCLRFIWAETTCSSLSVMVHFMKPLTLGVSPLAFVVHKLSFCP